MAASDPNPDGAFQASYPELLTTTSWVRGLAAGLVNEGAVDDVVQDAHVAALSARHVREPRGWVAGTVRNLVRRRFRGEAARAAREEAAARGEAQPGSAELVAKAELQGRLIQRVTALEEPYRSVVLLRFFEGLSLVEVGARMDVPASTVRTWLSRALDTLRQRLDAEHGGDRAAWCAQLAPLVPQGSSLALGSAGILKGVLMMDGTFKVSALAAGIALMAVAGWWGLQDREPGTASTALHSADPAGLTDMAAVGSGSELEAVARPAAEERRNLAPNPEPSVVGAPDPAGEPEAEPPAVVEAMLVDPSGRGLGGATLSVREGEISARTEADGQVRLEVPVVVRSAVVLVARSPGRATHYAEALLRSGQTTHLGQITLGPGGVLEGRVVDEAGNGIDGARIFVTGADNPRTDPGQLRRHGPEIGLAVHDTHADAGGGFRLEGVQTGAVRLWAHAEGYGYRSHGPLEVLPGANPSVLLTLQGLGNLDRISGVVLTPSGEPVPGAYIGYRYRHHQSTHYTGLRTDDEGRFDLTLAARSAHTFLVADPEDRWASLPLQGVEPGTVGIEARFVETPSLRVKVVDERGEPMEAFDLTLMDERGHGPETFGALENRSAEAGSEGLLELARPLVGFTVEVSAKGYESAHLGPYVPEQAPAEVTATLVPLPGVHGRVLAGGRPVEGAFVYVTQVEADTTLIVKNGFRCTYLLGQAEVATDAEGRFTVFPDGSGDQVVRVDHPDYAPSERFLELDPLRRVDGLDFVLGPGGAIEGRLLLPAGQDPAGVILGVNHGDGEAWTERLGPDGSYRFEGLAEGDWQLVLRDEELNPGQSSTSWGGAAEPIDWSCEVVAGATTYFDLDLRETDGGRLAGHLDLGVAANGWSASLRWIDPDTQQESEQASTLLDAEGRFQLAFAEPGSHRLLITSPVGELESGRLTLETTLELEPGERTWEASLPLGSARGLSADAGNSEVLEYRWRGELGPGTGRDVEVYAPFTLEPDGAFRLPWVPAGSGAVRMFDSATNRWRDLVTFAVSAGREAEVRVP